jgi:hypothetical protein
VKIAVHHADQALDLRSLVGDASDRALHLRRVGRGRRDLE